jgi:hypothetical protein
LTVSRFTPKEKAIFDRINKRASESGEADESRKLLDGIFPPSPEQELSQQPEPMPEQPQPTDRLAAIFRSPSIRGLRPRHTQTTQLKLLIDPEVHRKALAKGKEKKITVSLLVEEVLKAWLAEDEK